MATVPSSRRADELRPELILHYREGCHLCEDMQQQLHELLDPGEFRLTLIDIDEDEQLREAYNVRVPVLSLVPLEARLVATGEQAARLDVEGDVDVDGEVGPENAENRAASELCEHFLDLLAVREALASYNRQLLAVCTAPADR